MKKPHTAFDHNVFINCPFDAKYAPLFYAIIFTVYFAGFRVRCSKEINAGRDRLEKIIDLISECKYGIHDISRIQRSHKMPRFNMPFELGIDMGLQAGGTNRCRTKNILILETHEYRYKQFISDLSGRDISAHYDRVRDVITLVRDWLNDAMKGGKRYPLASGDLIFAEYCRFRRNLPEICRKQKLTINQMTYNDYSWIVTQWMRERVKNYP